jgi:hypothetical protein
VSSAPEDSLGAWFSSCGDGGGSGGILAVMPLWTNWLMTPGMRPQGTTAFGDAFGRPSGNCIPISIPTGIRKVRFAGRSCPVWAEMMTDDAKFALGF